MPPSLSLVNIDSAEEAAYRLLRTGELDPEWVAGMLHAVTRENDDATRWSAKDFRTFHFATMYLPMRYSVWRNSTVRGNPATERSLERLIRGVELGLWTAAACTSPPEDSSPEERIVRLVLGSETPLTTAPSARQRWVSEYNDVLSEIARAREPGDAWPRWSAIALHFASFYLPIELPTDAGTDGTLPDSLRASLEQHVHADAVRRISYWLSLAGLPRDGAGLPSCAPRTLASLPIRTQTEVVLLRR
ncbi:hypothetical protein AKJ09_09329 [Labilithrix luteola]|uniref:Uncharacterized protein n=1 Tax=Labilithrix luteola TaxID=1391654 RepID=A0A0K1QA47_9BACT|nr:hypothetical protein [Labilithrix luteola]AKV02666.1 hypothetical protein AKJ09_09329 [Labilithrix luteola]